MRTLDDLLDDHRELLRLCETLRRLVAGSDRPEPRTLAEMRREIAKRNIRHLADEAVIVMKPLSESPHEGDRTIAREYAEGLMLFRQASSAHYAKWDLTRALADLPAYRADVQAIVARLEARILWEETVAFRALARLRSGALPFPAMAAAGRMRARA